MILIVRSILCPGGSEVNEKKYQQQKQTNKQTTTRTRTLFRVESTNSMYSNLLFSFNFMEN